MRCFVLVSRMVHVLEADGAVGDGAALAAAYAEAVEAVNRRLEQVQVAIAANQVSNAVRLMEEAPRLLDEVSTLDFNQLPQWEALCERQGWGAVPRIERTTVERIMALNASSEMVAPILRMYRKAVRTNDPGLAVRSLRRLVEVDRSQDWRPHLAQAEREAQARLVAAFDAALKEGREQEAEQVAAAFLAEPWQAGAGCAGAERVRAYAEQGEARERQREGEECLALLRQLREGTWTRAVAERMVQALDRLMGAGLVLGPAAREVLEACRQRAEREAKEEAQEARWRGACEALHAATQREDVVGVRAAFAHPVFLDREPEEELLQQALLVLRHDEERRKRRVTQLVGCVLVVLLAVVGVSVWWIREAAFKERCAQTVATLEHIRKGELAIPRMEAALGRLRREEPRVYAQAEVSDYETTLGGLRQAELVRTNEVVRLLGEMEAWERGTWPEDKAQVQAKMERVETLLRREGGKVYKEDAAYYKAYMARQLAWQTHEAKLQEMARLSAEEAQQALVAQTRELCRKLEATWADEALLSQAEVQAGTFAAWRTTYLAAAPALGGEVDEAEQALMQAQKRQKDFREAVGKVEQASDAKALFRAREDLRRYYGGYGAVAGLPDLPLPEAEVAAVLEGKSQEQTAFAEKFPARLSGEKFRAFLEENVVALKEFPSFYDLYGISLEGNGPYGCLSKGRPNLRKPSYSPNEWSVEGELLVLGRSLRTSSSEKVKTYGELTATLLEPAKEVQDLCAFAEMSGLTDVEFEGHLLEQLEKHFSVAKETDFLEMEGEKSEFKGAYHQTRYPAFRRLQLVFTYLSWLKELNALPTTLAVDFRRMERLTKAIDLSGVPEDLSWACFSETRIQERNSQCATFLHQLALGDLLERYRQETEMVKAFGKVARWRVTYAGHVPLGVKGEKTRCFPPNLQDGAGASAPLYVLRKEDARLRLLRAFAPNAAQGGWWVAAEAKGKLVPGEPLFRVCEFGKGVDPKAELGALRKNFPASGLWQSLPLFQREGGE